MPVAINRKKLKKQVIQTEVGELPPDWKVFTIKELASITTGSRNTQDRIEGGQFPFYVRSQTVERIDTYSYDGEAVLTAGDGVGTGKVFHYINGKFDFHQRVYKISDFDKKLDGYFFFLFFSKNFYDRIIQMTAKSSVDSVRMEMIADMNIPVPPKAEQTAIATALSDADALIQSLEKLIAKKRLIKQGAMQELLKPKEGWVVKKLGEVGTFKKGRGIRKNQVVKDGLPCIRYGELYTHHNEYIKKFNSFINSGTAKDSEKLIKGDVLFAGSGETKEEIGKCATFLNDCEAYAGGDVIIFTPKNIDPLFLGFLLNSRAVARQKAQIAQGDAVVHIYPNGLSNIIISIPPVKSEQKNIANSLFDIDTEIIALESKLEKYKQIKQGMMQNLLTGKIRLV